MKIALLSFSSWIALASMAGAQVERASVRVPQTEAWTGQRIQVLVELRAPGSFAGTASFELPEVPGSLLLKVGNPVVSSETIEDTSWFVQTHEFALYSQRLGALEIAPFPVRFEHREGFVGPVQEVRAEVPGIRVDIRRPPGSEGIGFLVTTGSFEVQQTWAPQPGPVQAGATFVREIVQRAEEVSGMALAPAPTAAPEGVRVYPGNAGTEDRLQRGEFLGERRDQLTYLLTAPGTVTLPALRYVWWDPGTETLESVTLPAAVIEVAPAPLLASSDSSEGAALWPWLALGLLPLLLGIWRARPIAAWTRRLAQRINPPERRAARQLLRACDHHDSTQAAAAWSAWIARRSEASSLPPALGAAAAELQRQRFGRGPSTTWRGDDLSRALRAEFAAVRARSARHREPTLPALNPRS